MGGKLNFLGSYREYQVVKSENLSKNRFVGFDPKGRVAFRNLRIAEHSNSSATFRGSKTAE